jgi:long-chain acyl-CoA synthetase
LLEFNKEFKQIVGERTLIFILSENSIGSFAGYIASLSEKIVPLILSSSTEVLLIQNLLMVYQPKYIWLRDNLVEKFRFEVVLSRFNYSLVHTGYDAPPLHEELSLLLPTSGSTGSSKLVRHSYQNVEANARNVAKLFDLTDNERAMAILPMHYTMGLSVISSHIYAGATLLLAKCSLVSKEFWSFLKNQRATSFTGVPYSFQVLAKLRFFRMELPDLKLITQGGGKLSDKLFRTIAEYASKTNRKFIATYGQTEGTARMAYLPAELAMTKTCSIGKAIPGGELLLVDENTEVIEKVEAVGQMVYRGENVTLGYALNREDLMKGNENNGLLFTGDMARRDEDGCFYIVGRMSRFLKLFGFRVGLDECERLIQEAFHIECACIGNDDLMTIYITDNAYSGKVKELLMQKTGLIPDVFNIKSIVQLPKNEVGKIQYNKLRNQ